MRLTLVDQDRITLSFVVTQNRRCEEEAVCRSQLDKGFLGASGRSSNPENSCSPCDDISPVKRRAYFFEGVEVITRESTPMIARPGSCGLGAGRDFIWVALIWSPTAVKPSRTPAVLSLSFLLPPPAWRRRHRPMALRLVQVVLVDIPGRRAGPPPWVGYSAKLVMP